MRRPRFYDWKRSDFIRLVLATVLIAISGVLFMGIFENMDNIARSDHKQHLSRAERRAWQHQTFLWSER